MKSNKFVLDASVILKYLIGVDDKDRLKASRLIENDSFIKCSQPFVNYEILNVLRYEIDNSLDIEELYSVYRALNFEEIGISSDTLLRAALIAKDIGTSVYDTSYHVVALTYNMNFITADKKYYNKAKDLGSITLLSELKVL